MAQAPSPLEKLEPNAQEALESPDDRTVDAAREALSFVERLSEGDRRALVARARQERHSTGSVICREGDPGDALYIVESGQVAVIKESGGERPTVLGYRGAGEILGEMSLVSQQPRFASLVAVEDTELLRISAADFPALLDEHPGVSWAILNVLNDRLYASDIARAAILQEERTLARRLEWLTDEADRLAELARVRQETIELIVHDLQTPLTIIEGSLDLLRGSLSEETRAATGKIFDLAQTSTGRLMSLVQELLGAARREVPASDVGPQPVDLVRLLRTAVSGMQVTAEQFDISLELGVPAQLPRPQGNRDQLERVLGNLLDNAVSYTPAGGSVTVTAAQRDGEVEVAVTDTGPGVPAQHREQIFERFTRVPGVRGRRQGFGLGLYFCRQAVQAHRGRIWVEPGPEGVGSRFVFTLPIGADGTDG